MDLLNFYNEYSKNKSDPRTVDWFMMASPIPPIIICSLYPIFVQLGKHFMKDKQPLQIKNILIVYNFCMVVCSIYMVYEYLLGGWLFDYNFSCTPVDRSLSPTAMRMASVCWVFYLSKFVELLDTLFFIVRKKNNQITFLHVFHHGIMPVTMYFGVRFVPGGLGTLLCLINSFVHVFMYFYYGLSACGPQFQKYLWWKKYMTKMQMIQFVIVIVHSCQFFFISCDFPIFFSYWTLSYAMIFLVLFSNFYIQEFIKRQAMKRENDLKKQH